MRHPTVRIITVALTLSACRAYTPARYAVSVDSVETLRALHQKYPGGTLAVGDFQPESGGAHREASCRVSGTVTPPDGGTFERYLQAALTDDLRMAGVYSPQARVAVSARVRELNFSSASGTWTLDALVTAGSAAPFEVIQVNSFSTSVLAENACNQTAQAFMPAVQDFVKKLVRSPGFEQAFAESAKPAPGS